MAIRRKIGMRAGIRRRVPSSVAKQEMLKANLRRFQDVATRLPKATEPTPTPPKPPPPEEKARAAPVGEILPPERNDLGVFSPGTRMAEANRHVRNSVRDASTMIRESEIFFLGVKQAASMTSGPGPQEAAEMVKQAERSVADALEFALGPSFTEPRPNPKTLLVPVAEAEVPSSREALTVAAGSSS